MILSIHSFQGSGTATQKLSLRESISSLPTKAQLYAIADVETFPYETTLDDIPVLISNKISSHVRNVPFKRKYYLENSNP